MINLFNIPNYTINTADFSHYLHGDIVQKFEQKFCDYVGAKYACSVNSATNAIFLIFLNKHLVVNVPSMIPPVVLNALITAGNRINFVDDTNWIGGSYILHQFEDYKVIDSAQKVERDQFKNEANDNDLMFFSFYPTKPVGSSDGGIIVSNSKEKIDALRTLSFNGMSQELNNWDRKIVEPGYKAYLSSIQASIADKNLDKLDAKKDKLAVIRNQYNKAFKVSNTSDHLYIISVRYHNRQVAELLKEKGIVTGIHYDALHTNEVYDRYSTHHKPESYPNSLKASQHNLSIPFHEELTSIEIDYIIKTITNASILGNK